MCISKKELKKKYKEMIFLQSFQTQFSTKKIDIINRLINLRFSFKKAEDLHNYEKPFSKYRSLFLRINCVGLP